MSENRDDPCTDLEVPAEPEGDAGGGVPPLLPEAAFDPPRFPESETEFPGVPRSRRCVIIPRNLYYTVPHRMHRSPLRQYQSISSDPQSWSGPGSPPEAEHDFFRFVAGKFYTSTGDIYDTSFTKNPSKGLDFDITVAPAEQVSHRKFKSRIELYMTNVSRHLRFGPNGLNLGGAYGHSGAIDDWAETLLIHSGKDFYLDTTFQAPASFFAKEADGLNIRLPELTSMQVFISDTITKSELDELYNMTQLRETETMKKSLYERFAEEYFERPDYCSADFTSVSVHKYPAKQVALINEITNAATDMQSESTYSSFRRVFKRNYDFYTKISFDTNHGETKIAEALIQYKLDSTILGIFDTESPSDEVVYTQVLDEKIQDFVGVTNNDGVSLNSRPNAYEDVLNNLRKYFNPRVADSKYEDFKLIFDPATFPLGSDDLDSFIDEYTSFDGNKHLSISKQVFSSAFKSWMEVYAQTKKRTYKKTLEGDHSYSEIVAYRLEKRDAQTGDVVQNFYFFNDPDTPRIDFIDTQIHFGKRYTYNIYTINAVVGLKYNYIPLRPGLVVPDGLGRNLKFQFDVEYENYITFIEAPYFQQELLVLDAPPMPPDVWLLPVETNSEDLVMFWFVPRVGQMTAKPIAIYEEDLEIIEKMKQSQNVAIRRLASAPEVEILYKADSDPTHYEMLVLDEPPINYQDFALGRKDETTIDSPTFIKRVIPNKDYYITFRAKDFAGISNPTKVFKYRLSSYGDGIEHEVEEYTFAREVQQNLMSFNQFFSIEASPEQSAINFRGSPEYRNVLENTSEFLESTRGVASLGLGVDEDSKLWDKKFVIEIVSAVTGKKVQIMTTWKQLAIGYRQSEYESDNMPLDYGTELATSCFNEERKEKYLSNQGVSDQVLSERLSNRAFDETGGRSQSTRARQQSSSGEDLPEYTIIPTGGDSGGGY